MHDIMHTRRLPQDLAAQRRSRVARLLANLFLTVAMITSVFGVLWGDAGQPDVVATSAQAAQHAEPGDEIRAMTSAIAWDTMPVSEDALAANAPVGD